MNLPPARRQCLQRYSPLAVVPVMVLATRTLSVLPNVTFQPAREVPPSLKSVMLPLRVPAACWRRRNQPSKAAVAVKVPILAF